MGPTVAAAVLTPPPDLPTGGASPGRGRLSSSTGEDGRLEAATALRVGQNFGSRYHIIRLLGVGGMGAVYQAWDQTLEVAVALKVIRGDGDLEPPAAETLARRFKRELLLARQVTHKNVVRIHDLGEVDGVTYITMPYVQGSNLASILERAGRLPLDQALVTAWQVASGLAAAHEAGVIHRDLKPANIMIDGEGNALIMDFGIARSAAGGTGMGMTRTGAIVGTVEYMAPEQARGQDIDQRADIYSFGLILNDMLLGRRQGTASGVAELLARMQQPPPSLKSIDPTIPVEVDRLVTKCLQPDPEARYRHILEVVADLESITGKGRSRATFPTTSNVSSRFRGVAMRRWAIAALLICTATVGGVVFRNRLIPRRPPAQTVAEAPISVAVLPFRNASGDVTLDSLGPSLSEVLRTELGQSSRVRTVTSDRLNQVLHDLRLSPNTQLAPAELERAATLTNARTVIWGQVSRFGDAIRIDLTLEDLERRQTVPLNAMAQSEAALLPTVAQLAGTIRERLAQGAADVLTELKASSWKPSTNSIEALRLYNEGLQLTQDGDHQAALTRFEAAIKRDPTFALGTSALAREYAALGYDAEAAQFSRRALNDSQTLPPQEKYLIEATHFQIANDTKRAIDAYENLVKATPNNASVRFDLGSLYERTGDFGRAEQQFAKVVALDPKYIDGLLAVGRVEIRRGHPQESLDYLNRALTLAIELDREDARANVLQATGIAYKLLNRPDEALRRYQDSLDIKRRHGNKRGMAASFGEIAQIQVGLGQMPEAEKSFRSAIQLQREIGDKAGLAATLTNFAALQNESLGQPDAALPALREALQIHRETGNKNGEALVLNNLGNVYLAKGEYSEAQTYFERALELREKANVPQQIADTVHNLAETQVKMGHYDQALSDYLRALDLRRQAGDSRTAAMESYSIGTIFDYQGRYGAAVKSKEAALTAFRELKRRDMWLGEILSGYGDSLSSSGRMDDAAAPLQEAMDVARELHNPTLIAQTARFDANRLYLGGEVERAKRAASEAIQTATAASDRSLILLARSQAATIEAAAGPTKPLASQLSGLAQEADTLGLPFLAIDCGIQRAAALVKLGDRAGARPEIDRALARAEAVGFRLLVAKAHYVRAEMLRLDQDAAARSEYASALRILEDIKNEDGNHDVLKRADFGAMHAECLRWSKAG